MTGIQLHDMSACLVNFIRVEDNIDILTPRKIATACSTLDGAQIRDNFANKRFRA